MRCTLAINARSDQHAANIERQLQSVARALRRRVDYVDRGFLHLDIDAARRGRFPVSGMKILASMMVAAPS
jgi:hypothetical protein